MADQITKKAKRDQFSNVAYGLVTMSAANTLTFAQIQMGIGLFQGVGLLIHRVNWWPTRTSLRELVANNDSLQMALTTSNRLTGLVDVTDPAIICCKYLVSIGVAVERYEVPLVTDFTSLPGGGKLVPANPLWIGAFTEGAAAASVVRAQIDFSFVQLNDQEYLELIQSLFPANIA